MTPNTERAPRPRLRVTLALVGGVLCLPAQASADGSRTTFAGSVQLDWMGVPTDSSPREHSLDGTTVEMSLKAAVELSPRVALSAKICVACHGLETGHAYLQVRLTSDVRLTVGRFTPALGDFPTRHDPANHTTSDKPLAYDMGRMLHREDWNLGVLPAPWVDNGAQLSAGHHVGALGVDYAVYATNGPKGGDQAADFDYVASRTPSVYYVDNNSRPSVGGRALLTVEVASDSLLSIGASGMIGHYDPSRDLSFGIAGIDLVAHLSLLTLRAEYLVRRTEMFLGDDPGTRFKFGPGSNGQFDDYFLVEGFYSEVEAPIGPVALLARWDGLRRRGNVLRASALDRETSVFRYTLAGAYGFAPQVKLKVSGEWVEFSDFEDAIVVHVGVVGAF